MNKSLIITMSLALFGFTGFAMAEPEGERSDFRKKMMEKFDADKDGELSDDERKAAREAWSKHHGEHGKGGCHKGGEEMRKKILEKFSMMDCTPIATPMEKRL